MSQKNFTLPRQSENNPYQTKYRRQRKNKNRSQNRDFICGCGKTYQSYAALYTHTKTKHNGIFPLGTESIAKIAASSLPRPTRSKKVYKALEYNRAEKFLNDFKRFLDMVPAIKEENPGNRDKDLTEDFPLEIFENCSEFQNLFLKMTEITTQLRSTFGENYLQQIHFIQKEISNPTSLSCNEILVLFLLNIFNYINKDFYKEMVFYSVAFLKLLNLYAWEKLENIIGRQIERPAQDFCTLQSAELLPDFANQFVSEFIFSALKGSNRIVKENIKLRCFGKENGQILVTIMLTKLLCEWLKIYGFTKAEVEIGILA